MDAVLDLVACRSLDVRHTSLLRVLLVLPVRAWKPVREPGLPCDEAHRICVDHTRGRDLAMGKTATALGQEFGRTAREMNKLLREHGFMEGDPGAYRPTALGKAFAQAVDFDNGHGGFAHRQWGWLSWTDGLIDALKASMEANPDGVVPPAAAPEAVFTNIKLGPAALRTGSRAGGQFLNKNGLVAVVVLAGLGASTPVARRAWHERVKPAASKVRARIAERKSTKGAGGADEHDSGK